MYLGLVWLMIQVRREMLSKALVGPCRKEDATEETTWATPALHPIPYRHPGQRMATRHTLNVDESEPDGVGLDCIFADG